MKKRVMAIIVILGILLALSIIFFTFKRPTQQTFLPPSPGNDTEEQENTQETPFIGIPLDDKEKSLPENKTSITYDMDVILPEKNPYPKIKDTLYEEMKEKEWIEVGIILKYEEDKFSPSMTREEKNAIVNKELEELHNISEKIVNEIGSDNFKLIKYFSHGFSGNASRGAIVYFSSNDAVKEVIIRKPSVQIQLTQSKPLINLQQNFYSRFNTTGKEIKVCIIDTGIDSVNGDFTNRVIAQKCYCSVGGGCCPGGVSISDNATDDNGHGTLVAGILAANSTTNMGVAPDAKLFVVKALPKSLLGNWDDISDAIVWCRSNNVSLISMSLGDNASYTTTCSNSFVDDDINSAYSLGISLIAAAGNDGYLNGTAYPACRSNVVGVGMTYDDNFGSSILWPNASCTDRDRYIKKREPTCASTRGANLDLFAPGAQITASKLGGGKNTESGSSFSTPHVSGLVALLLEKNPGLTPDYILKVLNDTGTRINDTGNVYNPGTNLVFSFVDASAAIQYISSGSVREPVIADVGQGQFWRTNFTVDGGKRGKTLQVDVGWWTNDVLRIRITDPAGRVYQNDTIRGLRWLFPDVTNSQVGQWVVSAENIGFPRSVRIRGSWLAFDSNNASLLFDAIYNTTGGVNFTDINLNYVSTCNVTVPDLAMKGKKANPGDIYVNFTNQAILARDAFLTGLVIPNDRQWISLPIMVNGVSYGGNTMGDPAFLATEAGRKLLEADVELKYDIGKDFQPIMQNLMEEWKNMVQNSTKWPDIQAQNFNSFPQHVMRAWVSPTGITANGSDCDIFITNATMGVNVIVENVWLDLSKYSYSQDVVDELGALRNNWTDRLYREYLNYSNRTTFKLNNNSEYVGLRTVYTSLALAQWYKTQDWSRIPYGDFIDTSNPTGLGLNTSLNKTYWEGQAWQDLYTFNFTNFLGGTFGYNLRGGVNFGVSTPNVSGNLDNKTEILVDNITWNLVVQNASDYYFELGVQIPKPDIEVALVGVNSSLTLDANETTTIIAKLENVGNKNITGSFTVTFYYNYTYPNGFFVQRTIGNTTVNGLDAGQTKEPNITWTTNEIGNYTLIAEADYNGVVSEISEVNNKNWVSLQIREQSPTSIIQSPTHGSQYQYGQEIEFMGIGLDSKDNIVNGTFYNWSSDADGFLGNGSYFTLKNLTLGDHAINFTIADSKGSRNTSRIIISIIPSKPAQATINAPLNSTKFAEGETVYFSGAANDPEDGDLNGSSLLWNSSLQGFLGSGEAIRVNLSVGTHNVTLNATDSGGLSAITSVIITVEESTPNLTMYSPTNNSVYYYNKNISFNASSIDAHDGNLSSAINWSSTLDGLLGKGGFFNKTLSSGFHIVYATISDRFGLSTVVGVNLTVLGRIPPIVSVITPTGNETNGELDVFECSVSDPETGALSGNSIVWNSSLDGNIGNGTEFNVSSLSIGLHQMSITATDHDGLTTVLQYNFTVESAFPNITIYNPSGGNVSRKGDNITFNATSADLESGDLSSSIRWYSSLGGFLTTGKNFTVFNLSQGTHAITAESVDSHGQNTTRAFGIVIVGIGQNTVGIFSDGTSEQNLSYTSPGSKIVYVRLPKDANVTNATVELRGRS